MRQARWLPVAGVSGALFLGVLSYELGRAGAGGDPAIPQQRAAAEAAAARADAEAFEDAPDPVTRQS